MACAIWAIISLGGASPRRSLRPTRNWLPPHKGEARMETSSLPSSTDELAPAWPCSRRGLPSHLHCGKCWWSLTPPFHHHRKKCGCLFLWPSSGGLVPRPGCYPTSRSLECGLSSIPSTQNRDCPTNLSFFIIHERRRPVNAKQWTFAKKTLK